MLLRQHLPTRLARRPASSFAYPAPPEISAMQRKYVCVAVCGVGRTLRSADAAAREPLPLFAVAPRSEGGSLEKERRTGQRTALSFEEEQRLRFARAKLSRLRGALPLPEQQGTALKSGATPSRDRLRHPAVRQRADRPCHKFGAALLPAAALWDVARWEDVWEADVDAQGDERFLVHRGRKLPPADSLLEPDRHLLLS